ncbi:hypothetical protein [Synechococcus elongatus]
MGRPESGFSTLKAGTLWKTQMLNDRDRAKLKQLKQQLQEPPPPPAIEEDPEAALRQEFDDLLKGRKRIKPKTQGQAKAAPAPADDYVEFRKLLLEDSGDRRQQG